MKYEQDICFIQTAAPGEEGSMHPIHQKMAESVGAEFQTVHRRPLPGILNGSILSDLIQSSDQVRSDYDIYVFESPSTLYLLPKIYDQISEKIIIYLHTNIRFFGPDMYPFVGSGPVIRKIGKLNQSIDAKILRWISNRYLDGIITISNLFKEKLDWFDHQVTIATPFIRSEVLPELNTVSPNYDNNKAVYLGHNRGHKGLDILVRAWDLVREVHPTAELELYGKGHPRTYDDHKGVRTNGYAETLQSGLSDSSLFVHPARLDAYAVSPIEAMYSGIPALVTSTTGCNEVVSRLGEEMIAEQPSSDIIANDIIKYFNKSVDYREKLGQKSKIIANKYTQNNRIHEFEEALNEII